MAKRKQSNVDVVDAKAKEMQSRIFVKVKEITPTDRMSLCGEPAKFDRKGQKYFEIPAHQVRYQANVLGNIEVVGEPFYKEPAKPKEDK